MGGWVLPQLWTVCCISQSQIADITNIWESHALGESDVICVLEFFIWSIQSKTEGKAWKAKNLARTSLPLKSSHYRKKYFSCFPTRNPPNILSPLKAGELFYQVMFCAPWCSVVRCRPALPESSHSLSIRWYAGALSSDNQSTSQPASQGGGEEGCKLWWRGRRQI